jgi:hypothetical protein
MATFEPSEQLTAAIEHLVAERKRAAEIEQAATRVLYDAIAAEMIAKPEVGTTALANFLGYSPRHVRRIGAERGVPAKADVEPPHTKRRRREPSD